MKEHKCLMCNSVYFSNEPGYWGYCSKECENHSFLLDDEKKEVSK